MKEQIGIDKAIIQSIQKTRSYDLASNILKYILLNISPVLLPESLAAVAVFPFGAHNESLQRPVQYKSIIFLHHHPNTIYLWLKKVNIFIIPLTVYIMHLKKLFFVF
jgi:hypothetical protein